MDNKDTVRRFVEEAVNGGRDELIDQLFTSDVIAWARSGSAPSAAPSLTST